VPITSREYGPAREGARFFDILQELLIKRYRGVSFKDARAFSSRSVYIYTAMVAVSRTPTTRSPDENDYWIHRDDKLPVGVFRIVCVCVCVCVYVCGLYMVYSIVTHETPRHRRWMLLSSRNQLRWLWGGWAGDDCIILMRRHYNNTSLCRSYLPT